jgi:uncharacterized damage-inducible protein DinB
MNPELSYFVRLVRYNAWANAETVRSLRAGDPPQRATTWLAHLVGAEALWLARLRHEQSDVPVWPDLDLDSAAAKLDDLAVSWQQYLDSLEPDDLYDGVAYRNTKGEFWTSQVSDILTHVVIHQGYHRGQIAAALREAGQTPAYTDYIHAVRQGFVE